MPDEKPIGPVEVVRDKDGWWWHPGIPNFGAGEDPAPYYAWIAQQGLEVTGWHSGDEPMNCPMRMRRARHGIQNRPAQNGS